jgi:hypothetical protein
VILKFLYLITNYILHKNIIVFCITQHIIQDNAMQVRTEVLMAVTMKITAAVWDVMPSNLADHHQCSEGTRCFHLHGTFSLNDGINVPN